MSKKLASDRDTQWCPNSPKSSSRWGATMSYWLGVETPEVWAEANRTHDLNRPARFGFPEGRRKSVQQINVGDRIINYITKHCRFFAVWEVTRGYVHDPNHIFAGKAVPECVEVKPIVILRPERGIERRQTDYWGVSSVRMAAVRLDDDVGEKILSALQKAAESTSD